MPRLDFQVQNARNPFRCQPMTVSGLTITSASRQRGQRRERMTQNKRSSVWNHGRRLSRFRIATCWRRARYSRCSDARLRKVSRSVATRIMMVVCMPTTVAAGGRECYDFCGRGGFDEARAETLKVEFMITVGKFRCITQCLSGTAVFSYLIVLLAAKPAYAYLDAGTGSMILQLLIGGVAGALVVGKLYFRKIRSFFAGLLGRQAQDENRKDEV